MVKVDLESGRVVPGDHVRGLELKDPAAGKAARRTLVHDRRATAFSTGFASKSAASPPTMTESVPSMAPTPPPDKGASRARIPLSRPMDARRRSQGLHG